jgi:putative transposase
VDDITKQSLGAIAGTSISGRHVAHELTEIIARHRRPGLIISGHGTQFTCNARLDWQKDAAFDSNLIVPGKPMQMQNGFVECFNDRMCDELLTETLVYARPQARGLGRRLQPEAPAFGAGIHDA